MFMTACLHGSFLPGDSPERVQDLINEVMTGLKPGNPWSNMDVGETAELYFAPQVITDEMFDEPPFDAGIQNMLVVSVNRNTGFGALRWNFTSVAHNPDPPADPRVIGDPGFPRWYHPRYALPLPLIEKAVQDFCHADGARPGGVGWVEDGGHEDLLYLDAEQYRVTCHTTT
jgi:hypothetical protein